MKKETWIDSVGVGRVDRSQNGEPLNNHISAFFTKPKMKQMVKLKGVYIYIMEWDQVRMRRGNEKRVMKEVKPAVDRMDEPRGRVDQS